MGAPIDPTGFRSNKWSTVVGHSVSYLLDNGDTVWIIANDAEWPSAWQIQLHAVGSAAVVLGEEWYPMKPGALEYARGYMRKAGRVTVPTPTHRGYPWFGQSDIAKAEAKAEADKIAAAKAAEAEKARLAEQAAAEAETRRNVDRINAMLRGEKLYSCSSGHSANEYSSAVGTCPECGSIGRVI